MKNVMIADRGEVIQYTDEDIANLLREGKIKPCEDYQVGKELGIEDLVDGFVMDDKVLLYYGPATNCHWSLPLEMAKDLSLDNQAVELHSLLFQVGESI